MSPKYPFWLLVSVVVLLPLAASIFVGASFPEIRWEHYPFHAFLEGVGAFAAIWIALLIRILQTHGRLSPAYLWVAAGLAGMGLLDGYHSVLHAGQLFVWLHSLATFVGGLLFACVWLPDAITKHKKLQVLPEVTFFVLLAIAVLSTVFVDSLPPMKTAAGFTLVAKFLNIVGGLAFVVAAMYFIRTSAPDKKAIFANHCLLFGIAGLLFERSALWDVNWWGWHVLRFVAYGVVVYYCFDVYKRAQKELTDHRIHLEELVKERTKELTMANRELEAFAYSASHDLRTPLRGIEGFSQIILDDYAERLDPDGRGYFQRIRDASRRMAALIDDMLVLSRVSRFPLDKKTVDLSALANKTVTKLKREFPRNGVDVVIDTDLRDDCDEKQMRAVIDNLLSNAWKFTKNIDHPRIVFGTQHSNGATVYYIADNGVGFDMRYVDKVFKDFQRLHGSEYEGTGIGLSIAKRVISRHGGKIWAESKVGGGTTFFFTLSEPIGTQVP